MLTAVRSLAKVVGCECSRGRIHSSPHWRLRQRDPKGHLAWLADQGHQPAHGHRDQITSFVVSIRTRLAEWRDRYQDQPRVLLPERFEAQPKAFESPRRIGLDQKVGLRGKPFEEIAAALRLQVQRDSALSGVIADEVEAFAGIRPVAWERTNKPRCIAAGRFDLDNIGTQVGQNFSARESRFVSEIQHAIWSEGAVCFHTFEEETVAAVYDRRYFLPSRKNRRS